MDLMIKGKVAVVTAASQGLGRAVAESLASEGVNLAICSRTKIRINETAKNIREQYNVEVLPFVCDVTSFSDIKNFEEAVIKQFKTCDILFTNAGGPPSGKIKNFVGEDYRKAIELNLISTVNLVNSFSPYMKSQKWGRVLASTSSNIRQLLPEFPLSNVSRIGVVAFIKTFAHEFAGSNITANVLAPGLFLTGSTKQYIQEIATEEGISYNESLENIKNTIPVRSIGAPRDFGSLAAFLASEHASYITGETFLIDGGSYSSVM